MKRLLSSLLVPPAVMLLVCSCVCKSQPDAAAAKPVTKPVAKPVTKSAAVVKADKLTITPENGQHYRKVREVVKFNIQLAPGRSNVKFRAWICGNKYINEASHPLTSDADGRAVLEVPAVEPGFIYVKVYDGKEEAAAGVAIEPEKIRPTRPAPADFDAYWDAVKARYDKTPVEFSRERIANAARGFRAYQVHLLMGDPENLDAYGILTVPENAAAGSLPVRLIVHGAGTDKVSPVYRHGCIVFSLNPMPVRNDGVNGDFIKKGRFQGYRSANCDDRDKVFFNGMFQRVYRSLQFLKIQPEWDGKTVIISGTSQGGGQAIAGAGLDPDVTLCVAHVPALCSHAGRFDGAESGWPFFFQSGLYKKSPAKVLAATAYVDAVNFARRIKTAQVLFSTGFIDRACPSMTVYAAFNVIPSANKRIINNPLAMHRVPKETRDEAERVIQEHIKAMRQQPGKAKKAL